MSSSLRVSDDEPLAALPLLSNLQPGHMVLHYHTRQSRVETERMWGEGSGEGAVCAGVMVVDAVNL